jgi:hexosaminidase
VQQWHGNAEAAVRQGAKLIASPASRAYVDMKYDENTEIGLSWAALVSVESAYSWDPATLTPGITESSVYGVEAPLWTESVKNLTAAQYLAFPRLPGIAEIGWSPAARRDWSSYRYRLAAHAPRWHILGINYYRAPDVPWGR